MNNYIIDYDIKKFFIENKSFSKFSLIEELVNEINIFNNVNKIGDLEIDLLKIEKDVLDIIYNEINFDEKEYLVLDKYKDNIVYKLKTYGITLTEDIYLYQLTNIISSLNTLFSLDPLLIDSVRYELESDLSSTEIFLRIISDLPADNPYELIIDVQDKVINYIKEYVENTNYDSPLDDNVAKKIEDLINNDMRYSQCSILNYYFKGEVIEQDIDNILPYFYQISDYYTDEKDLETLARELYIVYYLATPAIENIMEDYKERVDLSLVKLIGENQKRLDTFNMELEKLIKITKE